MALKDKKFIKIKIAIAEIAEIQVEWSIQLGIVEVKAYRVAQPKNCLPQLVPAENGPTLAIIQIEDC